MHWLCVVISEDLAIGFGVLGIVPRSGFWASGIVLKSGFGTSGMVLKSGFGASGIARYVATTDWRRMDFEWKETVAIAKMYLVIHPQALGEYWNGIVASC